MKSEQQPNLLFIGSSIFNPKRSKNIFVSHAVQKYTSLEPLLSVPMPPHDGVHLCFKRTRASQCCAIYSQLRPCYELDVGSPRRGKLRFRSTSTFSSCLGVFVFTVRLRLNRRTWSIINAYDRKDTVKREQQKYAYTIL